MATFLVSFNIDIETDSKEEAITEARRKLRKGLFDEFRIQTYKRPDPVVVRANQAKHPGTA